MPNSKLADLCVAIVIKKSITSSNPAVGFLFKYVAICPVTTGAAESCPGNRLRSHQ